MSWVAPARSPEAEQIHAAAEADREARPDRYHLHADAVVERAARGGDTPASEFAAGWKAGLSHYLASAQEDGRLNALGTRMVIDTAVTKLRAGARIAAYADSHPDRAGAHLAPPVVIIGGWRTGTTFLFRLLATDPRLHAPLPAELTRPWRTAELHGDELEAFVDASAGAHDLLHVLNPTLRAVHDSGARLPEECVLGMGTDLRNWGFSATVRLDGYSDWLRGEDLGGSYRRYADLLRVLHGDDDRRLLLKAPAHTPELRHLVSTFPGVVVVQLHRDIVETIASGASLFAVYRTTYSDDVDPVDVGRFQADQTELWLRRAAEARADPSVAARATFLDVDYRNLVDDPAGVAAQVFAAAGMEQPADLGGFVDRYHLAHPRTAHGAHVYGPDDFGLAPNEVRERFASLVPGS